MTESHAQSYSLIIPTFNRPELLRRLLKYLERQAARFTILVLDSSSTANKIRNAEAVSASGLKIKRIEYDEDIPPFDKFNYGMKAIDTAYLSFCADDDVVVVPALHEILQFMEEHQDFGVAHGYYFNFCEPGDEENAGSTAGDEKAEIRISSLFYHSPSLADEDPYIRLSQLFRRYEALTYGVYRTRLANEIHGLMRPVESILGRELLSGALTVAAGKAARLKAIYYGRNTRASAPYVNWHPLEWLATNPEGLFEEYLGYRSILVEYLTARHPRSFNSEEAFRIVDLIHLRYLSPFLCPDVLDFALSKNLEKNAPTQVISGIWQFWNSRGKRGWRRLRDAVSGGRIVRGSKNRYRFDRAFLRAGPAEEVRVTNREIETVTRCLDDYLCK